MKKILVATLAIALAASTAQAASKKKAEEAPAEPAFKTALNIAATLTDGNSETMGANASLVQTLEYLPKIDDFDRYLLNAEVALDVAINDRLSLRFVAQDSYNSEPAAGADENDLSLLAGLGIKL